MGETPTVPAGQRLIDGYGNGGFRIGGTRHDGAVLILDQVETWQPADIRALTVGDFTAVIASKPPPEILVVGCGARAEMVPPAVREALRAAGIVIDAMNTGAACRTYNVLVGEGRRVAAALIPVD